MRKTRHKAYLPILSLLALVLVVLGIVFQPKPRPSIIFIVIDTLRADRLGGYGFEGDISPHLDQLANESLLFERCYSQAPWTKPSMESLLTSSYPQPQTVSNQWQTVSKNKKVPAKVLRLSDEYTTLAEILQASGYQTAGFVANPWMKRIFGLAQGFDVYGEPPGHDFVENRVSAQQIMKDALTWLDKRKNSAPFFLYLHFMDVHGPYQCDPQDLELLKESPSYGPDKILSSSVFANMPPYIRNIPNLEQDPAKRRLIQWQRCYAGGVRGMDRQLGTLFQVLKEKGLYEKSIILVTSDHGEELYDHQGWDHGHNLYVHQLHVPFILRLPRGAKGGRRISTPIGLVDVVPTLLAQAGFKKTPPTFVGMNLDNLINQEKSDDNRVLYASGVKKNPYLYSVMIDDFKLKKVVTTGKTRLFQITTDPTEKTDLAPTHPDVVSRLSKTLQEHIAHVKEQQPTPTSDVEITEDLKEGLKSLGYFQ